MAQATWRLKLVVSSSEAEAFMSEHPSLKTNRVEEPQPDPAELVNGTVQVPPVPAVEAAPPPRSADDENHVRPTAKLRVVPLPVPARGPGLPFDGTDTRASVQYRIIRTKLLQHPRQPRVMVVSIAAAGDGKTVSALNLAGALALKSEMNVLLVESDLRRPSLSHLLGAPACPGLGDLLAGECTLEEAIFRVEQFPNLCVLPAGKPRLNATELLDSANWKSLVATVRKDFKFTILDSPPVGAVADYYLVEASADSVILVARPDHTQRKALFRALQIVPKEKLLGVVINHAQDWFLWRDEQPYYYYARGRTE
jgi:capsular exopolysaccharide synthesis family protein